MSRRAMRWLGWFGIPIILVGALLIFWRWDWFVPLVEARASAALGRPVSIGHLDVGLGRVVRVRTDDVTIGNPPNWQGDPLAHIEQLVVDVDAWNYIRHGQLVIPSIEVIKPRVSIVESAAGEANYKLRFGGPSDADAVPQVGNVRIQDGQGHVVIPRLNSDFNLAMATHDKAGSTQIQVDAQGTYGGESVTGQLIGGALLSLRNASDLWPVDLRVENGPSRLSLIGTIEDPLHLKGAALKLQLAGPDASRLQRLLGVPIPATPPYQLAGEVQFAGLGVRVRDFSGRVGSSDLQGTIQADLSKDRPDIVADLRSQRVDLSDLAGLIGAEPGRVTTLTPEQRAERTKAEASPKLLPDAKISVPKLRWADVHLKYRGERILGRGMPLDNLAAELNLVDGRITVHPVSAAVGSGRIQANADLVPQGDTVRAKVEILFQSLDVSRLMAATRIFQGAGTISGSGNMDATGNSVAQMLGSGNGMLRVAMVGGDLSAVLVNLSGLQFGNALISALGLPDRTRVECFITDAVLERGVVKLRALVLDTGEGIVEGSGQVDLKQETVDMHLRTEAKHFSIGSLPGPIDITGTLKSPSIRPGAEAAVRGGLVAGLGVLLAPLAVLPTIQFGIGDDQRCGRLLGQARQQPGGQNLPGPGGKAAQPR